MNAFKRTLLHTTCFLAALLAWNACSDPAEDQLRLTRQFQPGAFDLTNGQTSATITWDASLFTQSGQVTYRLELATDAAFGTIAYATSTAETTVTLLDTEIDIRTDYYARVKALGSGKVADSNWLVSEDPVRITGEIFIQAVPENYIFTDQVYITWIAGKDVASVRVTPAGGNAFDVSVTSQEAADGAKYITGLTEQTTYTIELLSSEEVGKGSVTITTKRSYAEFNVIDLSGITGKPKILRDTLQDVAAGSVILLRRGENYTFDNTDLAAERLISKTITFVSAPGITPTFATISLTTNFTVSATAIDSIVFRDVNIRGARPAGASFSSDYILNSSTSGATIGKFVIENCTLSALRGVVRLQAGSSGTIITNYTVNKCKMDSVREYGVATASGASAFTNIRVTNSTFSHFRKFINHTVAGNNSVYVSDCTLNELPTGAAETAEANAVIDFSSANSATAIVISNCIIGKTWNEGAGDFVLGVRAGTTTTFNVTNTYTLSDFKSTREANLIPGVTGYPGASTSVFTSPATGNFLIKDTGFPGGNNAGDPRWRL